VVDIHVPATFSDSDSTKGIASLLPPETTTPTTAGRAITPLQKKKGGQKKGKKEKNVPTAT
jgi:hypothetical protein